ncbi:MAG: LacI family DNA-binding transcriptional regulator [Planctomycetota bacterium]
MPAKKRTKPSIASVARAAGVSSAAVSLVLGGRGGDYRLSSDTSARIRRAAAAQRYVRPPRRRGPSRLHIVHLADLLSMDVRGLGGAVLYPLMDTLAGHGWLTSVDPRLPSDDLNAALLTATAVVIPVNYGFDAAAHALAVAAITAGVQPVILGRILPDIQAIQVDGDQRSGGKFAAEHLLGLGHRHIAVVGGDANDAHTHERLTGFTSACAAKGVKPELWGHGNYRTDSAHRLVASRLANGSRPTAVFCCNDRMAVGALLALREAGLDVPRHVSLVGFDDQEEYTSIAPGLTTVRFESTNTGARIAALLEPKTPFRRTEMLLPARLVARGSSAPVTLEKP